MNYMKAVLLSNAILLILSCCVLFFIYRENLLEALVQLFVPANMLLCIIVTLIGICLAIGQLLVLIKLGKADLPNTEGSHLIMIFIENRFTSIVTLALLPAIVEEMLFRAALQTTIQLWSNNYVAIAVTSILFMFAHFSKQYKGQPFILYQVFSISIVLGISFLGTGNLIAPILIHFCYNLFSVEVMRRGWVSIQ